MVLTVEIDRLSHEDQIELQEMEVVPAMRTAAPLAAERDDPDGLASSPFIFLLSRICSDSRRSPSVLALCNALSQAFRSEFHRGSDTPTARIFCVVPEHCKRDVEESLEKRSVVP